MKAFITNNVNGRTYQVQKDSIEELNVFIDYQKNKTRCPWGMIARNEVVRFNEHPEDSTFVEVSHTDSEGVVFHLVHLPQQFSIHIQEDYTLMLEGIKNKLKGSDWLMVSDLGLSMEHRECYVSYRAYLRECHNNTQEPMNLEDYVDTNYPNIENESKLINKFTANS